jgi:hypothetical protein
MPASLDDILTTQKNGVVAINGINLAVTGLFSYLRGSTLSSGAAGTGSYSTLYTVPSGRQMAIVDIEICNTAASPATFYISLVPVGGTAGASNAIFFAAPIAGNTTVQWTGQQVLEAGGFVAAYASSSAVTIKVGGGPGQ